jgi:murein DD-endopeptidase MepM/ murein hydrolase activator NlpD
MPAASAAPATAPVVAAEVLAPPPATPAATPAPAPAPAPANVDLMIALEKGAAVVNAPPPPVVAPPPVERAPARASRNRTPATPESSPQTAGEGGEYVRPGTGRLTSGYGRRWGRLHAGIDLAAGSGSPIRAATNGTVLTSGSLGGYGQAVEIRHADGTMSRYAHMSKLLVNKGEKVAAGAQIGREGNTGNSTGPHLHFEVRVNNAPIDPAAWLRKHGVSL